MSQSQVEIQAIWTVMQLQGNSSFKIEEKNKKLSHIRRDIQKTFALFSPVTGNTEVNKSADSNVIFHSIFPQSPTVFTIVEHPSNPGHCVPGESTHVPDVCRFLNCFLFFRGEQNKLFNSCCAAMALECVPLRLLGVQTISSVVLLWDFDLTRVLLHYHNGKLKLKTSP